jgi:hypothetical protein
VFTLAPYIYGDRRTQQNIVNLLNTIFLQLVLFLLEIVRVFLCLFLYNFSKIMTDFVGWVEVR